MEYLISSWLQGFTDIKKGKDIYHMILIAYLLPWQNTMTKATSQRKHFIWGLTIPEVRIHDTSDGKNIDIVNTWTISTAYIWFPSKEHRRWREMGRGREREKIGTHVNFWNLKAYPPPVTHLHQSGHTFKSFAYGSTNSWDQASKYVGLWGWFSFKLS